MQEFWTENSDSFCVSLKHVHVCEEGGVSRQQNAIAKDGSWPGTVANSSANM